MKTPLNLPHAALRTRLEDGIVKVWDPLRRKYVALTPEEFVRQHFTAWLRSGRNYPAAMMANEVKVPLNGTLKRCDTLVYDRRGLPLMVVEYKAPDIKVSQDTFNQIVRYNMELKARYLVVSNGVDHYCCEIDYSSGSYRFLPGIPDYNDIMEIR